MKRRLMILLVFAVMGVISYAVEFQNAHHRTVGSYDGILRYENNGDLVGGDKLYIVNKSEKEGYKGKNGDAVLKSDIIEFYNGDIEEDDITITYLGTQPSKKEAEKYAEEKEKSLEHKTKYFVKNHKEYEFERKEIGSKETEPKEKNAKTRVDREKKEENLSTLTSGSDYETAGGIEVEVGYDGEIREVGTGNKVDDSEIILDKDGNEVDEYDAHMKKIDDDTEN
ncbi:MAG: hypothetical protein KAH04_07570 [Psychrilyobacter sp.]|nr:hypothetical protein [Psychrilyobacter sp.]